MKKYCQFLVLLFVVGFMAGCSSSPAYNVEVYVSPMFKEQMQIYPSLEVDVVGVGLNETERFEACQVSDYFEIGNALRQSTRHITFYFSENDIEPKSIDEEHSIWEEFGDKNASQLYVLVNLPEAATSTKGTDSQDIRKIVIPLEHPKWFGSTDRFIEITPVGINVLKSRPTGYPEPRKEVPPTVK